MKVSVDKSKRIILGLYVFYLLMISYGCASKPSFQGMGNLSGLLVDENNHPVENAVVSCWKGPVCLQKVTTNAGGIFTFYDLPSGSYEISAEKTNYGLLKAQKYRFSDSKGIFCCQINSMDYLLDCAEEKMLCGQYDQMFDILDNITLSKNSSGELAILFYKACGKIAEGKKKDAQAYLKRLSKISKAYSYSSWEEIEALKKVLQREVENENL
ncbi:MAG: carboxypeptidase-like regulatory domain-containing protein [Treponema sp.]|nr:carboxypeptidase-like regulatory domain-containing protein [Treponema sp.]